MTKRIVVALAAVLATSQAAAIVHILNDVPVCPPTSYTSTHIPHFSVPHLAVEFGPTPAGSHPYASGKCGIGMISAATGVCPGQQAPFAYDIFDYWNVANPPIDRQFRQELQVDSFAGIPIGGRVKVSELSFSGGETVSFYLDRPDASTTDMTIGHRICASYCLEEEVGRFDFPILPPTHAVPMIVTWSTGRHIAYQKRKVSWSFGNSNPPGMNFTGLIMLKPGAQELTFSNGIVHGICGADMTRVRFVEPRFVNVSSSSM